ncbi:MAG TPA: hypothetical protein VM204_09165 [Gaiellaceae bacterium]|nr:hypothetical protein [Gaiellaceae bacterium]
MSARVALEQLDGQAEAAERPVAAPGRRGGHLVHLDLRLTVAEIAEALVTDDDEELHQAACRSARSRLMHSKSSTHRHARARVETIQVGFRSACALVAPQNAHAPSGW